MTNSNEQDLKQNIVDARWNCDQCKAALYQDAIHSCWAGFEPIPFVGWLDLSLIGGTLGE